MTDSKISEERVYEIMDDDSDEIDIKLGSLEVDNALMGLNIIAKYIPKAGVEAASHDMICGESVENLVKAGITEADVIELRSINWMLYEDSFAYFV